MQKGTIGAAKIGGSIALLLVAIVFSVYFVIPALAALDNTVNTVILRNPANNTYVRGNITLNASLSGTNVSDNATFYYQNSTGYFYIGLNQTIGPNNFTFNFNTSILFNGVYSFFVNATNLTGSVANATNGNITVDNTAPTLSISTPSAGQILKVGADGFIWVNGTIYDNLGMGSTNISLNSTDFSIWSFSGANNTAFTARNNTYVADGYFAINVGYLDAAGNAGNATRNITVDNTVPVLNFPSPANASYVYGTTTQLFQINVTETNFNSSANITLYYMQHGGGGWTSAATSCYDIVGSAGLSAGGPYKCNATISSLIYPEGTQIDFFFNTTDLAGNGGANGTQSNYLYTTIDRTAPKYANLNSNMTNATTIKRGTVIKLTANWSDNYVLDSYKLSHNGTSSWANTSSAFSGSWSNVTIGTSEFANGVLFQAKIYANDSANNENATLTYQWTIDGTAPTYANYTNTTNNTQVSKQAGIKIMAQWADNLELQNYWLWENVSVADGGVNVSFGSFPTTGNWTNITLPSMSSLTPGNIFQAKIYANDTSNNENYTKTYQWTIDNQIPQYSSNDTNSSTDYAKSILIYSNWSDNIDLDYAWLETNESGTLLNVTAGSYGTININLSSEQTWSNFTWYNSSIDSGTVILWRIYVNDTTGNENVTINRTFTFDNVNPVITIITPANNSYNNSLAGYEWINGTIYDDVAMSDSLNISITGANASQYEVYNFSSLNNTAFKVRNNTPLNDGQITITIGYMDKAGNIANKTILFYKDTAAPSAAVGLTNSSSGTYAPSASQAVQVAVTDALQTNASITLNYTSFTSGVQVWTTKTMTGTPGTTTIYSTTIDTTNPSQDNGWIVRYYIIGVDNATNSISAVSNNVSYPLGNLTIDIYCGNNGTAWTNGLCTGLYLYGTGWKQYSFPSGTAVINTLSSLSGNRTTPKVLESIQGKYNIIYYYNGTQWTSYDPSVSWAQNDLKYMNNTNTYPYHFNMTAAGVVRIA